MKKRYSHDSHFTQLEAQQPYYQLIKRIAFSSRRVHYLLASSNKDYTQYTLLRKQLRDSHVANEPKYINVGNLL